MATVAITPAAHTASSPSWKGWLPVVLLPAAVVLLVPADWPRWAFMWLFAVSLYAGLKWLTWRQTAAANVPAWRHLAYLVLWPGLDAAAFLGVAHKPAPARPSAGEWLLAAAKLLLGALLLWGVAPLIPGRYGLLLGWIGMAGIVFVLHFGTIHLLSCLWRGVGVDARPLMHWPIAATSLGDF